MSTTPNIPMREVKSGQIASIGYDTATKTLGVSFKSGGTYHYHDVSQEEHDELLASESMGSHLHKHIKPKHKCSKLKD